jgi:hypothetical protein
VSSKSKEKSCQKADESTEKKPPLAHFCANGGSFMILRMIFPRLAVCLRALFFGLQMPPLRDQTGGTWVIDQPDLS